MGAVSSACENCFNAKDTSNQEKPKRDLERPQAKPNASSPKSLKDRRSSKPKAYDMKVTAASDETQSLKMMDSLKSLNSLPRNGKKKASPPFGSRRKGMLEVVQEAENKNMTISDFQLIKVLGRGAFGKVYFVRKHSNKKYYALKTLKKEMLVESGQVETALNEQKILSKTQHPFVVRMHYSFQNETTLYFVLDFCAGGELFNQMKQKGKFDDEALLFYVSEMVAGIQYLHEDLGLIYGDLKPENILLDGGGHIKITDFGLSKEATTRNSFCGTPEYLAPEIIERKEYDRMVDWWSVGCVMYEMVCGYPPYRSNDQDKLFNAILTTEPTMPPMLSKPAEDLIRKLLVKDPKQRLGYNGAEEIKKHSFFAKINWDEVVQLKKKPPFVPALTRADDLKNFDKKFTTEVAAETPSRRIQGSPNAHFGGFTYERREGDLMNLVK